jgi:hypothetical protein
VAAHAYEYFKRLRGEEREKYEYQQALVASELQALKMQLHPTFSSIRCTELQRWLMGTRKAHGL